MNHFVVRLLVLVAFASPLEVNGGCLSLNWGNVTVSALEPQVITFLSQVYFRQLYICQQSLYKWD